ncbi:MAG TPA: right-handed parallel beta-helix repeat-containing protein [Armatimonadota bacterium]|jgi:parallel beta-helix repeat protein
MPSWPAIVLFALICAVVPTDAAVLRVNQSAPGQSPDGATWSTAFAAVDDAVRAAAPGDEIWVAAGVYAENLYLDAPLSLYGGFHGMETARGQRKPDVYVTTLSGSYAAPVITSWADIIVDGFSITEGYASADIGLAPGGGGICALAGTPTIANNLISGNIGGNLDGFAFVRTQGAAIYAAGDAEIAWNDIRENLADGCGGVACDGASPSVHNNLIRANWSGEGGALVCSGESALVYGNEVRQNPDTHSGAAIAGGTFVNNTVTDNGGAGVLITGRGLRMANNLIVGNGSGVSLAAGAALGVFRSNDVFNNSGRDYQAMSNPTGSQGNISAAPGFTNAPAAALHLRPDSPCHDAGDDAFIGEGWLDIDGEPRRMGRHVDIGADEVTTAPVGAAIFVSPQGNDRATGLTWAAAKRTLGAALQIAAAGNEIWLADSATQPFSDTAAITWLPGVSLYAGFAGTETARAQRNPAVNICTIYNRITVPAGAGRDTVLDGFTLSGSPATPQPTVGGGVFCTGSSPTLAGLTFTGLIAQRGAAIGILGGSPLVTGCTFTTNRTVAGAPGGCVYAEDAAPNLLGCFFREPRRTGLTSRDCGGVTAVRCQVSFTGCSFSDQSGPAVMATDCTGTIAGCAISACSDGVQILGAASQITLRACAFTANETDALIVSQAASADARDCVFALNAAAAAAADAASLTATNCTLVWNGGPDGAARSANGAKLAFRNSIIAYNVGGVTGPASYRNCCAFSNGAFAFPAGQNGNITRDPVFAASTFGDYHIQPSSPCRDAGDDAAVQPGETDADGRPRRQGARVDIGAYESDGSPRVASSAVLCVRPDGNDAGNGRTWSTAKRTVRAAVDASPSTGAEVWVAAGTYTDGFTLKPGLRVLGGFAGWESSAAQRAAGIQTTLNLKADILAPPNVSRTGGIEAFTIRSGRILCAGSPVLARNTFVRCPRALWVSHGSPRVVDNLFLAGVEGAGAITVSAGSPDIANNTFSGNGWALDLRSGSPVLTNNIIAYSGYAVTVSTSSTPTLRSNCFFGNGDADALGIPSPIGANGNIRRDPLFLDAAHGNFHIQPASPCANAGAAAAALPGDKDIDGAPRVSGVRVDIGADESDVRVWKVTPLVIRVKPSGDDHRDGSSWPKALRTLRAAMDLAAAKGGADIWAAAGTYGEAVTVPPFVSLYGGFSGWEYSASQRRPKTSITLIRGPSGAAPLTVNGSWVPEWVDGFTVWANGAGAGVIRDQYGPLSLAVQITGGVTWLAHNTLVAGGVLADHGAAYIVANFIDGRVHCSAGRPNVLANHISGGVSAYSAALALVNNVLAGGRDAALDCRAGSAWITGNTIARNAGGAQITGGANVVFANNIVAENGAGLSVEPDVSLVARGNDVYGNAPSPEPETGLAASDGNVAVDPRFAAPEHNDLRLRPDSPLRDAGDSAYVSPGQTDVDGRARVIGPRVDIGASEVDGRTFLPMPWRIVRVSPAGLDANDGSSWALAKRSLSSAADAARLAGGGEIWAAEGIYATSGLVLGPFVSLYGGFAAAERTRDGRDPDLHETVVDGGRKGGILTALDGYRTTFVDGCTFRNGAARLNGSVWLPAALDVGAATVANNLIALNYGYFDATNRAWSGVAGVRGGRGAAVEANTIAGNYGVGVEIGEGGQVRRNQIYGNVALQGAGVYVTGNGARVADNVIASNSAARTGGGIMVEGYDSSVVNNTIAANSAPNGGGASLFCPVTFANNIVAWNTSSVFASDPTGITLSHNSVIGGYPDYDGLADPTGLDGNAQEDPLFMNGPDGDYRLLPASPCIDAGDDAFVLPGETDLDGHARIRSRHVDMGAYEF